MRQFQEIECFEPHLLAQNVCHAHHQTDLLFAKFEIPGVLHCFSNKSEKNNIYFITKISQGYFET